MTNDQECPASKSVNKNVCISSIEELSDAFSSRMLRSAQRTIAAVRFGQDKVFSISYRGFKGDLFSFFLT